MPNISSLQDLPPKGTLIAKVDDYTEVNSTNTREKYDFHHANIIRGKIDEENQDVMEKEVARKTMQTTANNADNCRLCNDLL